jgi:hypothetical protein
MIHDSDKKVKTIEDIDDIPIGKRFVVKEERKYVYKVEFNEEERYIPIDKCIEIFQPFSKEKLKEYRRDKKERKKKKVKIKGRNKSNKKHNKNKSKSKGKKPKIIYTPMGNNIR